MRGGGVGGPRLPCLPAGNTAILCCILFSKRFKEEGGKRPKQMEARERLRVELDRRERIHADLEEQGWALITGLVNMQPATQ
eukprot:scaffold27128_cov30-Prasinocladus_malaysianus.AAC.4